MILLNAKSSSLEILRNGLKCKIMIKIDETYFKMSKFE